MPDLTGGTTRDKFSELVKAYNKFEDQFGVNYCFASIEVKGGGDIDNIGVPVMWSESDSAFIEFAANSDWAASTAYSAGDVVKPTTQDGYEYVCITAGTSNDIEGEPTFVAIPGATTTETDGVVWLCRPAYSGNGVDSPLPNGAHLAVIVGPAEGRGFNYEDTTLSSTAVYMTSIYRGPAALAKDGFEWGTTVEADQDEFYTALQKQGITIVESGTTVDPTFV
jgi:hypothetical protein